MLQDRHDARGLPLAPESEYTPQRAGGWSKFATVDENQRPKGALGVSQEPSLWMARDLFG